MINTKQVPDFYYSENSFWVRLFPNNPQAVDVYNELARQNNGELEIFISHKKSVFSQLKKAGYTIRKAPKVSKKAFMEFLNSKEVNDFFNDIQSDLNEKGDLTND